LIDQWDGHTKKDQTESERLLKVADYIFCEWGLGNIEWYSHRKRPDQKLIVRIHSQESRHRQFLDKAKKNNIDYFIFIAPYKYEEFLSMHNIPRQKAKMIFNTFDVSRFDKRKERGAEFNLGFAGIVPFIKRFDKALELFSMIWVKDSRYRLFVKGRLPEDYPWMHHPPRDKELEEYRKLYKLIKEAPWGANVVFEGHGSDMPEWFQKIGYLLSTSDLEGSHQAVAEGMASGAIPVILNWPGSDTVYPQKYIFTSIKEMSQFVLKSGKQDRIREYAYDNFDIPIITDQIKALFE
jgi:glycosyltransferase involved in cell wall biosynthesis